MVRNSDNARLEAVAFETAADARLLVDATGALAAANVVARRLFNLTRHDVGSPFQNLALAHRPLELRPAIERASHERRDVTLKSVAWDLDARVRHFDVVVSPLFDADTALGVHVTFTDVTAVKNLENELAHSKQELEKAYEELQSTNEELETTNEELQSTVEELETTNEELQSTNEELETMNEELQSGNEELQTMNDELRERSTELNTSKGYLETVFTSLPSGVVVVNRDLRIEVWNAEASNLWGVRQDEAVGTSFFNLDIGLPVAELHQPIRDVLTGSGEARTVTLAANNRRGRALQCRVAITPLRDGDGSPSGAIMFMDEVSPSA
jgi:two-component system CheB/CheR fusion protein